MTKPPDSDNWLGEENQELNDWESAFQADDFEFSPNDGEAADLFKDQAPPSPASNSTAYEFTPPAESDLTDLPDLEQSPASPAAPPSPPPAEKKAGDPAAAGPVASTLFSRLAGLQEKFTSLPLVHKLAIAGTGSLFLLLALVLTLHLVGQPGPSDEAPISFTARPEPVPKTAEGVRRKWNFSPFFLPVQTEEAGDHPLFLEVDLTILLVLGNEDQLPEEQKPFVRDLVYRYFRAQPAATLRRYALARAEMNRNLLEWLRQEWPQAPIETVIFNRYQLT